MEHTGFPSDETLAAFIDGRLDPETRGKVIAHMTTCSECYSVFVNATEMTAAAAPESSRRTSRTGWLAVAIAATAAAMSVIFLVTPVRDRILPRGDAGMVALAKAAPPERIIAGRISGFPYQPMTPVMRGTTTDPMKNPANAALLTASAGVERSVIKRRSPGNLHASGVAHLLLGDNKTAIDLLHEALLTETEQRTLAGAIEESDDVPLLNDLSAALSNRAVQQRNVAAAAEAVRCADRAFRLERTPQSAWNRAVAIESLNGSKHAKSAWNDYLAIDATSSWAAEARKKLAE